MKNHNHEDVRSTVKKLMQDHPSLSEKDSNLLILDVWEQHNLGSVIGGVAISLLRHFIKTAPNAATILRARRTIMEERK